MALLRGPLNLVGMASIVVAAACAGQSTERQIEQQERAAVAPVQLSGEAAEARPRGIAMGREDAPVLIHEFADFQCPACAQFAQFGTPLIKERYVDTGTVRYVHYDLPLVSIHPHAFVAARAGRCADEQGGFWEYHDELYAHQRSWSGVDDVVPLLVQYAGAVGLDRAGFERCLRSARHADEITRNMRLAESLGVRGTPTIFINGQRAEIRTLEELEGMIRAAAGSSGS
jgi:protein-disulfide isomerase